MAAPITQLTRRKRYRERIVLIEMDPRVQTLPTGSVWVDRQSGIVATVMRTAAHTFTIPEAYRLGYIPGVWIKRHFPDIYAEMIADSRKPYNYQNERRTES